MEKEYCPYCMNPVQAGQPCANCGLTKGNYTPSPHHLPPGTVLKERYLVGRVLGEGGFGITYIGCDLQLELKVAIKEYFPTDRANRVAAADLSVSNYSGAAGSRYESGKARFLQEARTMARMDKQQVIVSVRDFFELNNTAYIVMEYVEGITFKELVARRGGRIPAGELLYVMEPLFFALEAMHKLGLIHRDISPENLMLENGEVRLLDFGCARDSEDGDATLTIALKHGYAPVEQYQNKGQGAWSDVYALSATIYFCLTGKKPPQSMDRLVEDELVPPGKLGVDLTRQQEKALLYGMGVRPRQRFQSVRELHTALYEGAVAGREGGMRQGGYRGNAAYGADALTGVPGENGDGVTISDLAAQFLPAAGTSGQAAGDLDAGKAKAADTEMQSADMTAAPADPVTAANAQEGEFVVFPQTGTVLASDDKDSVGMAGMLKAWLSEHRRAAMIGGGTAAALLTAAVTLAVWQPWEPAGQPAGIPGQGADLTGTPASGDDKDGGQGGISGNKSGQQGNGTQAGGNKQQDGASGNSTLGAQRFSDAAILDNGTAEDFLALLADDTVLSIMLTNCNIVLLEAVEVNKPVSLMGNVYFNGYCCVTVGENGYLLIGDSPENGGHNGTDRTGSADEFHADFLRTVDGGKIHVNTGGIFSAGVAWLEQEDDLLQEDGAEIRNCSAEDGSLFVFSEEEIFSDAIHVTTEREYQAALFDKKPIVIDADMSITPKTIQTQDVPVLISEGVTVKARDRAWLIGGAFLVNRGRLEGRIQKDGWRNCHIINYGVIDAKVDLDGTNIVVNYKDMRVPQGDFGENTYVCNMGNFFAADTADAMDGRYGNYPEGWEEDGVGHVEFGGGCFRNFGVVAAENTGVQTQGSQAKIWISGGARFENRKEIRIGADGQWMNETVLDNRGSICCTDRSGSFTNYGIIYNAGPGARMDLLLADVNKGSNTGVIVYGGSNELKLPEGYHFGGGSMVCFSWEEPGEDGGVSYVNTVQDFRNGMAREDCHTIIITDDIVLPAGTVITKGVAVPWDCTLRMEGDVVIRGEDAFLYCDGGLELTGGKLIIEDGTCILNKPLYGCSGLQLYGERQPGKLFLLQDMELEGDGEISIELENGNLIGIWELELRNVQMKLGGVLRACRSLKMYGCQVEVLGDGASLLTNNCDVLADAQTVLINHGTVDMSDGMDFVGDFRGKVENYGRFCLWGGSAEFGGEFINYGELCMSGPIRVSGRFTNQGSLVYDGAYGTLEAVDGGEIIGGKDR